MPHSTPLPIFPLAFYVDNFSPFFGPHWGNIGIRYYGLSYLLGFILAAVMLKAYARAGRSRLPGDKVGDLMVAVVFGTLLGGRIGYFLLYRPGDFISEPLAIFRVWEGGMASHGGMLGVAIALFWYGRSHRIPVLHLGDLIVSVAPIGLFFGRLANFINGELWGKVSHVPWAVIFPLSAPPDTPLSQIPPRHPSQLYEAGLEGLAMLALMQWRFWRSDIVLTQTGRLSGEFFLAYAVVRVVGERFREPDASLILGLSRGTFYSLFLIVIGLVLILRSRRKARVH
jgi:phosphatidylglycerol---prolipoprotein diacylglyceryl transferase